jgi:hypothetical protein
MENTASDSDGWNIGWWDWYPLTLIALSILAGVALDGVRFQSASATTYASPSITTTTSTPSNDDTDDSADLYAVSDNSTEPSHYVAAGDIAFVLIDTSYKNLDAPIQRTTHHSMHKVPANSAVEVLTYRSYRADNPTPARAAKVRVLDGPQEGLVGWLPASNVQTRY